MIGSKILTALLQFVLFATISFSYACKQSSSRGGVIPRDTTITISSAYSELFVDSVLLEDFIAREAKSDSIAIQLRNFYNARNYSFAWFDENGPTVQAEGFWSAHKSVVTQSGDSSIYDAQLHEKMDTLFSSDSTYVLEKDTLVITELRLTKHFFSYVQYAYGGEVDPKTVQWNIPLRKLKPVAMLDSLLSNTGKPQFMTEAFHALRNEIFRYTTIQKNGGWISIDTPKMNWETGDTSSFITSIKKRLQSSDDYNKKDTSSLFTNALKDAIKNVETNFGLKVDGMPDEALITQLNVSVDTRIRQMLINLERIKWMPELPANYLLANIPEYRLHIVENDKEVMTMNIVVGQATSRSVIFSDELKFVVFSPYWNIPRSIIRNEILPEMNRNSNYISEHNMEVTGYNNGLPVIRQKPGGGNALGRIKFIFPNSYRIYFHDTPSKSLFNKQQRAFSHGCIRLQNPFDLAVYLLRNDPAWTNEKIKRAMYQSKEKWVTLDKVVPVFITYFTSWVDVDGELHFAEDIYGHDKRLAAHLFEE